MDEQIGLISETYATDSIGQEIATETITMVWARISSIERSEWLAAGQQGLQPEFVAETPVVNYSGEELVERGGTRYSIYRVYREDDGDTIELYCRADAGVKNE